MDSLTQFALGSGVGLAVLGRRIGPRKAALVGGVLGTLPDLDVFYPFDDPIDAFVLHRGPTHSLVVQAALTPLFGEALRRMFQGLREHRWRTWLAVYLCFATHALLDALTVYGTRIFWPLAPDPVGVGAIFIIDPLYTLPLVVAVVWALCLRSWTARFGTALVVCLTLSTAYLGWALVAQRLTLARASEVLAEQGIEADRMLATPTPFNTLFWRVIAIEGERYLNLYLPVLASADAATAYVHPRGNSGCFAGVPAAETLARFSKGFFRVEVEDRAVILSDLRMGLTPNYAFQFRVAEASAGGVVAVPPERIRSERRREGDLDWLLAGIAGLPTVRRVEAPAVLDPTTMRLAFEAAPGAQLC